MKIWIDDVREAPADFIWIKSVNEMIDFIDYLSIVDEYFDLPITLVDMDHDAGAFAKDGGDYIKFLDYCEETWGKDLPFDIHIHSMNPVGVENMRRIIKRNGWKEVF